MRVIVFFDLPVETKKQRRDYTRFRKYLIKEGFFMMQQSVYTKLVMNLSAAELLKARVRSELPPKGLIQLLVITEKQFSSIENLVGEVHTLNENSTDRLIIL
ncbi:MAG: CRISPR-associated endonuclease Cas2 [Coriobacteriia bacterium]|nr:CRISPR-associated endonuclease Cas2 [Coriobacteriia bacterium]